ncbi:ribosome biogenesis GTP-binding protein YihA/YsxC [Haliangium sp.]|uniref:ribosome biogenesis GTP-binding protein YihA/YsxC n=1 Tax=Haliangium sp. TaxID=2663208 RepID=UPI003D1065B8
MKAKRAEFVTSAAKPAQFPRPTLPEIAFAGRSNVGKSSLINTLVGVPGLARTSRTPGRTRLLNWFRIVPPKGPALHFVDLPGYGFAKVPRAMRAGWRPLIEAYLADRDALRALVVLIDARRGAQEEEIDLLAWLDEIHVPALTVLTKSDKLPKNKRKLTAMAVKRSLNLARAPILFSALDGTGLASLWQAITHHAAAPRSADATAQGDPPIESC